MTIIQETQYQRGFKHGRTGHYFDPPLDNYGKAYYRAGFNVARNDDICSQCTDEQKRIIQTSIHSINTR